MAKMNYKPMYIMLQQQVKALRAELEAETTGTPAGEIPTDFNKTGWDSTIAQVEKMLEKMKQARELKGNLLTPQFYRSIYNRTQLAGVDLDKLIEKISLDDENTDYEAECMKLNSLIYELNQEVAPLRELAAKKAADEKAAKEAEEKAAKEAEEKSAKAAKENVTTDSSDTETK